MIPQEKAREIVIRMQFQQPPLMFDQAKHCALIAVNELFLATDDFDLDTKEYWQDVKQEIEKL
jgi:hypothetical protein